MGERSEMSRKVAIQGERGSFSHAAVLALLGVDWMPIPHATFDAAFQAVTAGAATRALIPFENSLAGSVHENYDRLSASPLHIIGEVQLRIRQCLIARPGATLAGIRRVSDLSLSKAQAAMAALRSEGLGTETINHHVRAVKAFRPETYRSKAGLAVLRSTPTKFTHDSTTWSSEVRKWRAFMSC